MSEETQDGTATEPGDFSDVFVPEEGLEPLVLVGGHAVNLWALYFVASGTLEMEEFKPFTSKDLDLVGTREHLEALHQRLKGEIWYSEPRSPVIGRLQLPLPSGPRTVDILHTVRGLDSSEIRRHVDLVVNGIAIAVIFPQLVLKAKIVNSVTLDQGGRNDVKHVRMMILCTRAFIVDLRALARTGSLNQREVVNFLEEVRSIVTSPAARKAAETWDFDFSKVWPLPTLLESGDKIARFASNRL